MTVTRNKMDLSEEKKVLSHLIANSKYLEGLRGVWRPELFETDYCRLVSSWVAEYFEQTGTAPGRDVEDLYLRKKGEIHSEDTTELIADFLRNLSNNYHEINNLEYEIENGVRFFRLGALRHLRRQIDTALETKDPTAGENRVGNFRRVGRAEGSGVDLFLDTSEIVHAFDSQEEELFVLNGALGKHVGPIVRGDFVSFLGRQKVGKSWWLLYTAFRAVLAGRSVVYFNLEMTKREMTRRAWQCFHARPLKTGEVRIPKFAERKDGGWTITTRTEEREGLLERLSQVSKDQKWFRSRVGAGSLRIITYPSFSMTYGQMVQELENLEYYDNFIPDVIVVDYADIFAPDDKRLDVRHQLDDVWKKLRGLAVARDCAVITASQGNRLAAKGDIDMGKIAEEYRKGGHVTKMFGINRTPAEVEKGITRIQTLLNRSGKMTADQIVVLGCYDIGRTYLDSKPMKEFNENSDENTSEEV